MTNDEQGNETSNDQVPNPKEGPIPKLQPHAKRAAIGIWRLEILCALVLGFWEFEIENCLDCLELGVWDLVFGPAV